MNKREQRKEFVMPVLESKDEYYTYDDYASWPDDVRYELIEGVPYMMSPAPSRVHQEISGSIFNQLYNYLDGKQCNVYDAPFDVRLNADEEDDTVVQPDILVVCDQDKLDDKGAKGAPDVIVEILSPSTASHDSLVKLNLYRKYGVKEYWIVDPVSKVVTVHLLKKGEYVTTAYGEEDTAPVTTLKGCEINLAKVFAS
jgi:Uma2 family endonuclease